MAYQANLQCKGIIKVLYLFSSFCVTHFNFAEQFPFENSLVPMYKKGFMIYLFWGKQHMNFFVCCNVMNYFRARNQKTT